MSLSGRDNTVQKSALHRAASFGNVENAKQLKRDDQSGFTHLLHMRNSNDEIPLEIAAPRGHFEMVQFLIEETQSSKSSYRINKHQYSPLLSAVRWYCKVLDGTYNENMEVGLFNIGDNKDQDYLNLICLLMHEFPEHLYTIDKKSLYAMHYVYFHLKDAVEIDDKNNIEKLTTLTEVLVKNGMSLHRSFGTMSPYAMAKNGNCKVFDIFNQIEKSIKPVANSMAAFQKPVMSNDSKPNVSLHKSKKQKVTDNADLFNPEKFEFDFSPTLHNYIINTTPFDNPKNDSSSIPRMYSKNESQIRQKRELKKNTKNNMKKSEITLNKYACQDLASDIFKKFTTTINYRPINDKEELRDQALVQKIEQLLIDQAGGSLTKRFHQDKCGLIVELAATLRLNTITTGFLCCRKTKRWIEFDEDAFIRLLGCGLSQDLHPKMS